MTGEVAGGGDSVRVPAEGSLNVLLVLPGSLESNNGFHAAEFAIRLSSRGAEVRIAADGGFDRVGLPPEVGRLDHGRLTALDPLPKTMVVDIVHAWTPRERVRQLCAVVMKQFPEASLVVHLEDDERLLTTLSTGMSLENLLELPRTRLDALIAPERYHPVSGRAFLDAADGISWVIDSLDRYNPHGLPSLRLPPLADEALFYPRPVNRDLRTRLGIPSDHLVISYCGNVHTANRSEIGVLYRAVAELNCRGCPTTLLRSGMGAVGGHCDALPHVVELGWVERAAIPEILAAADVLIQPGEPGAFNDSRIPCKLPEYFAMGRPVILPRTNLGLSMRHGVDAFVVDRGDAASIVAAVTEITGSGKLRERLEEGAIAVFLKRLCEPDLASSALDFYHALRRPSD